MSTQAVTSVLDSLADAWSKGDADAYGAHFTKDASYITFVGTMYHGRHDIIESHRALFEKFTKGTRLSGEISEVRFYRPRHRGGHRPRRESQGQDAQADQSR